MSYVAASTTDTRRRDSGLLLSARILRAFGFGFSAVLIAVHLQGRHFSSTEIGLVLAVALLAAALGGLLSAAASGRFGRRRVLMGVGLLMTLCGLDLAFAPQPWLLVVAALTSMLGVSGTDLGPFLAVEQAVLAQSTSAEGRNRAFARYSFTGALSGAFGALTAGVGTNLDRTKLFFLLFAGIGLATAVIPLLLSDSVEGPAEAKVFGSMRPLAGLLVLFSLDALGGGLVVNAITVYWLHVRYGATPEILGPSFAAMSLVTAGSQALSGRLADRFGLVNTMVFTHLPSSLMLFAVPFAPNLVWAIGLLLVRSALASMDVPARQAYVVSIVRPNERSGAIAMTGAARGLAQAVGPIITGAAIQAAAFGVPFIAGGLVKSVYDIGLYIGYRRRFGDHEAH